MFTKYCGSRALEKLSLLCTKLILNRDQLVKYLGFPMPELDYLPFVRRVVEKLKMPNFLKIYGTSVSNWLMAVPMTIRLLTHVSLDHHYL